MGGGLLALSRRRAVVLAGRPVHLQAVASDIEKGGRTGEVRARRLDRGPSRGHGGVWAGWGLESPSMPFDTGRAVDPASRDDRARIYAPYSKGATRIY